MAFTPDNLSVIAQPISGTGIRFLSYRSNDPAATVTGAGYFTTAASFGVKQYDLIFVTPISVNVESYIVVVTDINAAGAGTASLEPPVADGSIGYTQLAPTIAALIQSALQPAAIGTTVQAHSANLDEYASVNPSAFALTLLDDADAATALATLGTTDYVVGTWTPTVTATTGTITTVGTTSGQYARLGNRVDFAAQAAITTNGTGATSIRITLPITPGAGIKTCIVSGRENGVSGKMLHGVIFASTAYLTAYNYDGTYPGTTPWNGMNLLLSGTYFLA